MIISGIQFPLLIIIRGNSISSYNNKYCNIFASEMRLPTQRVPYFPIPFRKMTDEIMTKTWAEVSLSSSPIR